jgi:PIN domain nuclease of toxin-antitoxin system
MPLLDTHIVLSALGRSNIAIPKAMRDFLSSQKGQCVSVATIWEIAIKSRLGKIGLEIDLHQLPELIADLNLRILPVQTAHAIADIGVEPATKDPFDRLLLGICAAEGLKLVTLDRVLAEHPLAWRES